MSDTDAAEANRRAEWLHKHKAPKDWIILTTSEVSTIREELAAVERERDEARDVLAATKHYLTKERDDALSQIVQAECRAERFCQERDEARIAIISTLEENRHLADGDNCTLAKLKSVVPEWK